MKRRNFLASLLALPFVAKVVERPVGKPPELAAPYVWKCPHCGEVGGKPVDFHPWNDPLMPPEKACTLCQNWIDLDANGSTVTVLAGENMELGDPVYIGYNGRGFSRPQALSTNSRCIGQVVAKEFRVEEELYNFDFAQRPYPRHAALHLQVRLT